MMPSSGRQKCPLLRKDPPNSRHLKLTVTCAWCIANVWPLLVETKYVVYWGRGFDRAFALVDFGPGCACRKT
jgi:hypothetical protein